MKTKINELCRAVGITTAYQLQKATDLSPSQAARLYKDDVEAISLSVLEKLCDALNCSPNAIFGYDAPGAAKHQIVKPGVEKRASTPETPKKAASVEGMLSTAEVARQLGINERTVRDNYNNKKLPYTKIKGNSYVSEADFEAFKKSREKL